MRVTRDQLAAHRDDILTAATRLFRARGIEGVSVAEIMNAAGLTHGGFYGHYRSKSDLAAAACRSVLTKSAERWRQRAEAARSAGQDPITAIVSAYLSPSVLDHPGRNCAIPSLGIEIARDGGAPAAALGEGVEGLLAVLTELCPRPEPERAAMAALSTMAGGVLLARTLGNRDRAVAILAAAGDAAIATLSGRPAPP
jgi:TetR/AcrR family transcriptional repressor of nem operon